MSPLLGGYGHARLITSKANHALVECRSSTSFCGSRAPTDANLTVTRHLRTFSSDTEGLMPELLTNVSGEVYVHRHRHFRMLTWLFSVVVRRIELLSEHTASARNITLPSLKKDYVLFRSIIQIWTKSIVQCKSNTRPRSSFFELSKSLPRPRSSKPRLDLLWTFPRQNSSH